MAAPQIKKTRRMAANHLSEWHFAPGEQERRLMGQIDFVPARLIFFLMDTDRH
jgi:hypothetical protein